MTVLLFNYMLPGTGKVLCRQHILDLISGGSPEQVPHGNVCLNMDSAVLSELLERISAGEQAAFEILYRRYFRKCFSIALYFVHAPHLAEDIVAEVFLALWNRRNRLDNIRNWESYLFVAVRNHALSYAGKYGRIKHNTLDMLRVNIRSAELSPEEAVLRNEFENVLQEALERLPDKSRMVYYMVREEKMSYREISEILGISERTVNTHMSTAVRRLVASLKDYFDPEK